MGYFNYFIKCVIRKFVNMLFKPKSMIIILITIFMLYLFCGSARAEWTDQQVLDIIDELEYTNLILMEQLNDIEQIKFNTENLEDIETILSNIDTKILTVNSHLGTIKDTLNNLNTTTETIRENTFMINSNLIKVINDLKSISSGITDVYNKLDENQQQLLGELDKDNQAVLEELNMIRDAINGSEEELTTYNDLGIIPNVQGLRDYYLKCITLNYEPRYTYTIKVTYSNPYEGNMNIFTSSDDNLIPNNFDKYSYDKNFTKVGIVPPKTSNYLITYNVPTSNNKYIYLGWGDHITKIEVFRSIKGITESLNDSNSLQQQQNQLQQESNQLQQEQNDFLSKPSEDSDVSVDSFNNVDSNDITSSGLSGVFNTIYNSITSWNSKDIVLPIPKVNKNITIPANYTENMMSKIGGGVLVNIIHTVYYFIVARFMIYSITGIINSIKSGSILETDTKNNITTDML